MSKFTELSTEARLLIAFVLMGLVLLVSQYLYKPVPTPTENTAKQTPAEQTKQPEPAKPPATPPPAPQVAPAVPGEVKADQEESITIETDLYKVVFSNRGAVARSWVLKKFKEKSGNPLELVNQASLAKVAAPFAVVVKGQALPTDPNTALFKVERSADGLGLTFEYSDGRADTRKTFMFNRGRYLVDVTSEVSLNGVRVPHSLLWRGGFGDPTVTNPLPDQHAVYYDLTNSKLNHSDAKVAKDGPVTSSGQFSFAGVEDKYFAAAFLPTTKSPTELATYADNIPNAEGKDEQRVGTAVGGEGENHFTVYVGPKDVDILRTIDPKLEQLIDWGTWFGFIAKPLFLALNFAADKVTHNFGWAIVLVTIALNLLLFPLRFTAMKSSRKMQTIQPQVNAINEKIKSLPAKDPRRAELQQQQLELYKAHGVNPVGGCLPMVLQIPVLVALSTVLSVAIELRGASWLWVHDLSQAETLPIRILPVLLVVVQFITQRMTPTPGMDPAQQKMMMFMPLVFGYMFYYVSAGLALYWLTGGLVGMAQQWFLNRGAPAPAPAVITTAAKKKRN